MRTAIYARTSRQEKKHHTITIPNQIAFCLGLARKHNLTAEPEHVFTDPELPGSLPPSCWALEDEPSRPALSALVEAVEAGAVDRVVVRRLEKLATTSELLLRLLNLFQANNIKVVADRECLRNDPDPNAGFAARILAPVLILDTDADAQRRTKQRQRNVEEIERLKARIHRLETEIAALDDDLL
jgi:DNA invertase Pin-like site-specific DNA recombinase